MDKDVFPKDGSSYNGITKRELFAGLIMAAIATVPSTDSDGLWDASLAVRAADVLIEALEKR